MTILATHPRAIFIHIPKTGGNSVRSWMLDNVKSARAMFKNSFMKDHAPYAYIQTALGKKDNELVFAIVRNPWDRVVSAYHYHRGLNRASEPISFEEFVHTDMRSASRPQVKYVDDTVTILRLENIDEDFKLIQNYFNCHVPLPRKNSTQHDHYISYYDDVTLNIVKERFKEDIETYGYTYG